MIGTERALSLAAYASAAIALFVPLLMMAMGSPFYVERWPRLTLGLWILGLVLGLAGAASGTRLRPVGWGVALGTVLGALSFAAAYIGLFSLADWD